MDCVFCKIIKGEIATRKVYEDDHTFAFLDMKPVNLGHTLVIPKTHYESFLHVDKADLEKLIHSVQKIAKAVVQALGCEGFNLGQNNGVAAGQTVPHVHFHIMPRKPGDGYELWHGKDHAGDKMEEVAKKPGIWII
ncbi:HIT family protein [Candidatus Uhrbacteria bacterium]|nr:HIT family protein [Candidatus Uhrbacteria bacterium]